jgi:hypothetical protein
MMVITSVFISSEDVGNVIRVKERDDETGALRMSVYYPKDHDLLLKEFGDKMLPVVQQARLTQ